jgi:hypothetical protein
MPGELVLHEPPPPLDLNHIVHRLRQTGMTVNEIADCLSLDRAKVRFALTDIEPDLRPDGEIRDRMLAIAHEAMSEAMQVIKHGAPNRKDPMIRAIIASTAKVLSKESTNDMAEMRLEFQKLFGMMRGEAFDDTFADTALIEPDDPDETTSI